EYSGSTLHAASTSSVVKLDVVRLATTTTLTANPSPANYGEAVTLAATVSGNGTVSGKVRFYDGPVKLGEADVTAGKATLVVDNLTAGSHSLTAVYAGSSVHLASTSAAISLNITQANTKITLESSSTNTGFAQTVNLTATVEVN